MREFVRVLAIDPGPEKSAILFFDGETVGMRSTSPNEQIRSYLKSDSLTLVERPDVVAIEMIASYGMAVGKEVFETCVWIGRFIEASLVQTKLVYRRDVKMYLCGTMRAKDTNIRQALIDKHGKPGTTKRRGPTFGVSGHLWSALAIASYVSRKEALL